MPSRQDPPELKVSWQSVSVRPHLLQVVCVVYFREPCFGEVQQVLFPLRLQQDDASQVDLDAVQLSHDVFGELFAHTHHTHAKEEAVLIYLCYFPAAGSRCILARRGVKLLMT